MGIGASFRAKVGAGGEGGVQSPVTANMYGGVNAAGPSVITGELLFLVIVELAILGWIRLAFVHNFGG